MLSLFFLLIQTLMITVTANPALAMSQGFSALLDSRPTMFFLIVNFGLIYYFAHRRFDRFAVVHGPEILTTSGIFGCFLGISLGLLNFDTSSTATLEESVPQLLEGIKTAFFASLSGVGGALYIRFRHRFTKLPIQQTEGLPKAASLDDLVSVVFSLHKSLIGNEDSTLLSQLKLMRQDQNDHLQKLRNSFDQFAITMAEQNSKALIEALKVVIRDFNAKINDQFGDNFKQLNAAVEKLVTWQQQYKEELDRMKEVQQSAAKDMRTSAEAFGQVVQRTEAFTTTADKLKILIEALSKQTEQITESEKTLHAVLSEMRTVIPEFNTKIRTMIEQITDGAKRVQAEVDQATKNLTVQLQSSHGEMKKLLTESIEDSRKQSLTALQDSSKQIREQVLLLDKALEAELTKALESLGRQLASLSDRFVSDYAPLTERLQQVLQISRNTQ